MKVNLLLDNAFDIRSGYINIDPFAPEGDPDRVKGDVSNLKHAVDEGEADEIVALEVLDYFPAHGADVILSNWLSMLKKGGKLTLSVVDVKEVARAILANTISMDDANELLHGKQEKPWQHRKSSLTLSQLVEVLSNRGYKILAKRVKDYRAVVTCQRI